MKNSLLFFFLFCFSAAFGQSTIPEAPFSGSYDTINYEEGTSELIIKLEELSKPLLQRIDSLEQVIKKEKDNELRKHLEQLLLLIRNDSLSDVYNKIQQLGTKVALEINKKTAPPNFFYRLDREYYSYIHRLHELQKRKNSANTFTNDNATTLEAKDCQMLERFPYDSLLRTVNPMGDDVEERIKFTDALCKTYRQPVTEEDIDCALYSLHRIIICGEVTEIFIKKTWKWGGVFCFYNINMAIKESDYEELTKIRMKKAIDYKLNNGGEK